MMRKFNAGDVPEDWDKKDKGNRSFMLFSRVYRDEVKSTLPPGSPITAVGKELGERWQSAAGGGEGHLECWQGACVGAPARAEANPSI